MNQFFQCPWLNDRPLLGITAPNKTHQLRSSPPDRAHTFTITSQEAIEHVTHQDGSAALVFLHQRDSLGTLRWVQMQNSQSVKAV